MDGTRKKTLKVRYPNGSSIIADISSTGDFITVVTEPISETLEDGTACDLLGRLSFTVHRSKYANAIEKTEDYLRSLLGQGGKENGNRDSSVKPSIEPGGNGEIPIPGDDAKITGKNGSPLDSGGDGDKPTPRPKKRKKSGPNLGEESDSIPKECDS